MKAQKKKSAMKQPKIIIERSVSKNESPGSDNSYQSKVLKEQKQADAGKFLAPGMRMDSNAKARTNFQINVGKLGELSSQGGSSKDLGLRNRVGTVKKSKFASQNLIPQHSSVSFSNRYQYPDKNYGSKLSWDSSDSSDSSSEEDYLNPKPDAIRFRRKSRTFAFDFATDRQQSVAPAEMGNDQHNNNFLMPGQRFARVKSYAPGAYSIKKKYSVNNPENYREEMKSILEDVKNEKSEDFDNEDDEVRKKLKAQRGTIMQIIRLERSWLFHF